MIGKIDLLDREKSGIVEKNPFGKRKWKWLHYTNHFRRFLKKILSF